MVGGAFAFIGVASVIGCSRSTFRMSLLYECRPRTVVATLLRGSAPNQRPSPLTQHIVVAVGFGTARPVPECEEEI